MNPQTKSPPKAETDTRTENLEYRVLFLEAVVTGLVSYVEGHLAPPVGFRDRVIEQAELDVAVAHDRTETKGRSGLVAAFLNEPNGSD